MKKIAFIIPDLYNRGMPRVLESLENNISKSIYDKYIILLKKEPIKFHVEGKIIEIDREGRSFLSKLYIFVKRLIKLYNINKKYKFDYIISFGMTSNIISIIVFKYGKIKCKKIIITEHNVKSIENNIGKGIKTLIYNKVYNFFIRKLYNKADSIVSVSKYIGLDLIENYGIKKEKICTIYNGVNKDVIDGLKCEVLSDSEYKIFKNPVIINVGALSLQKGQWHLIKIMPELRKKIPNVQLVILGNGECYKELLDLVKTLNLSECVHLLGVKDNPYKYMYNAKVFVLSSLYEGFPNVLVEAMTVGIPVISVDCKSGPRELFQEKFLINEKIDNICWSDFGVLTPDMRDYGIEIDTIIKSKEKILESAILEMLMNEKLQDKYRKQSIYRAKKFTSYQMTKNYIKLF